MVKDSPFNAVEEVSAIAENVLNIPATSDLLFDVSLLDGKTKLFSTPVGAQQIAVDGTGKLFISAVDGAKQLVYQQSFGSWSQVASGTGGFFAG